ncbi:MAG TPA: thermonuclease family protein [Nocardioidaceae bacterium]
MFATHRVIATLAVLGVVGGGLSGCAELTSYDVGAPPEVTRAEPSPGPKADRADKQKPKKTKPPVAAPKPRPVRTFLVVYVVDGDTVDLANGERVRLVGIDTPERGECGSEESTANLERLVLGKRVRLRISDEDRDGYGRLLRYVDVGRVDAGLRQIEAGLAVARYDSRDGYGYHPRENRYIAADKASPDKSCGQPKPVPLVQAPAGCEPGYAPCVPVFPPDVDCADVAGPVRVTGPDPHGLDRDGDGIACE